MTGRERASHPHTHTTHRQIGHSFSFKSMARSHWLDDAVRKYCSYGSGCVCMLFGIILALIGGATLAIQERWALFWYLIGLGSAVFGLGFATFLVKCLCPQLWPDRNLVEKYLCPCIA